MSHQPPGPGPFTATNPPPYPSRWSDPNTGLSYTITNDGVIHTRRTQPGPQQWGAWNPPIPGSEAHDNQPQQQQHTTQGGHEQAAGQHQQGGSAASTSSGGSSSSSGSDSDPNVPPCPNCGRRRGWVLGQSDCRNCDRSRHLGPGQGPGQA